MEKRTIFYIVAILIVCGIVFASQMPYFRQAGQEQTQGLMTKGSSWVKDNVLPKIGGEVAKRGDMIKNELNQEKEKISQNILEKVGNYFSGIENSILHPGAPQNCPAPGSTQTQAEPQQS